MRQRATKRQILVSISLLAAIAAAAWWWAPHIWWAFLIARNGVKIARVPVAELKPPAPTAGWFRCRAGALSFELPPDLAQEAERSVASGRNGLTLKTPRRELTFFVPFEIPAGKQPQITLIAEHLNLTPIGMIIASYQEGTDDFRWTMSHAELRRHQLLLDLGSQFYPHRGVAGVETRFAPGLEGALTFDEGRTRSVFEWRTTSGRASGFLSFSSSQGDLNLDDVRRVCQSLACDESQLGPEPTADQLALLADSLVIVPDSAPASAEK